MFRNVHSWVLYLVATLLAFAPRVATAQSLLLLEDRVVEVVGLRQWSLAMLQDSLASRGDSLHTHACAATLRYKLGFADAAATTFVSDGSRYSVVAVVEPQDSARVRHRDLPMDTTFRAEWSAPVGVIRERPHLFHIATDEYDPGGASELYAQLRDHLGADTVVVRQIWDFLAAQRGEDDFRLAAATLASDPSLYNRMVAAAILANFAKRDDAWWALVETLRERDGAAKAIAASVLTSRSRAEPRDVDWEPAAPSIHALLNGTGLFELRSTLQWLPRMGAGPRWSRAFLADGGEMVLAYLQAEHPPTRAAAHQFLVAMRGADLGTDVGPWRNWIASLSR